MGWISIRSEASAMLASSAGGSVGERHVAGVASGICPSLEQWRGVVPANILARAGHHAAVAMASHRERGKLMSPHIVKEAVSSSGRSFTGAPLAMRGSSETAQWLRGTMRSAALRGPERSEHRRNQAGGKTGDRRGRGGRAAQQDRHVASFIGLLAL